MFEKIWEFIKQNVTNAWRNVSKSFRRFLPVFLVIALIECIFLSVFLSFRNNCAIRTEQVEREYDYHVVVSGLSENQMLALKNDKKSLYTNEMNFEVIKTVKYDSTLFSASYAVYIKLLTGNKDYGINGLFIEDSLSSNFRDMRHRYENIFGTEEKPNKKLDIVFSPLYTLDDDLGDIYSLRNTVLCILAVFCAVFLTSFYRIYTNNQRFLFGLYATFGANAKRLRLQAFLELLICSLLALLPCYYISSGLCALAYSRGGGVFRFRVLALNTIFGTLLFLVPVLLFASYFSMKLISRTEPMKLIAAADNSNLVSSPRKSLKIHKRSFPLGYETVAAFRFRRHHTVLALFSALLCVLFVLCFYFSSLYNSGFALRQKTSDDYNVVFSKEKDVPEAVRTSFAELDGVAAAHNSFSESIVEDDAALLCVNSENVTKKGELGYNKDLDFYYTGFARCISSENPDIAAFFVDTYEISGDPAALNDDPRNIIIGSSYRNKESFSFSVGDTVRIAVPQVDEDGKMLWNGEKRIGQDATGLKLWMQQMERISYRYIEFNVVAVLENYPSGANGVPVVMNAAAYTEITGKAPVSNALRIRLDEGLSSEEWEKTNAAIRQTGAEVGGCTVVSTSNYIDDGIETSFCYRELLILLAVMLLFFIPMHWFYSQGLFFRKREHEFDILHAISAPRGKLRAIYMSSSITMLPIGLLSVLAAAAISLALYYVFGQILPNLFQASGAVVYHVQIPAWVYITCFALSLACSILSAILPWLSYERRMRKNEQAEMLSDES